MRLFELAKAKHEDAELIREINREINYTHAVREQARALRDLIERVFGLPFNEAFDTVKVVVQNEGHTFEVDEYVYLHYDAEGLEVVVYDPACGSYVGRVLFSRIGPDWHEANILGLGTLLGRAHLQADQSKNISRLAILEAQEGNGS